ncbi:MAG: hypothetical protein JWO38_6559 [Gemmataceae bacterium]|nr:hypothetical protein [Gemmataceae bacterium]
MPSYARGPWLAPAPGSRPVLGRVSGSRVRLHKRLTGQNSFQTVLIGVLEPGGEGTTLRGRVGMHPGAIGYMAVYFAVAAIGSVYLGVSAARGGAGGGPLWAVIVPLAVLALGLMVVAGGAGVVWLGRNQARDEDEFLLTFVMEVLAARKELPAEPAAAPDTGRI